MRERRKGRQTAVMYDYVTLNGYNLEMFPKRTEMAAVPVLPHCQ